MDDLFFYEEIVRLKRAGIPAALVTVVATEGSTPRKTGAKMLVHADSSITGTIGGGRTEADVIDAAQRAMETGIPEMLFYRLTEQHGHVCGGDVTIYLEPLQTSPLAVVIGAGHVGRAVTDIAAATGFLVTLIDTATHNTVRGDTPDVVRCGVNDLHTKMGEVVRNTNTYIFIATSDHTQDFIAADAALNTKSRYISMLGSTRKRKAMDEYLQKRGHQPEERARIICPAGLEIQAETPEEIAVSVVAQMIRNKRSIP